MATKGKKGKQLSHSKKITKPITRTRRRPELPLHVGNLISSRPSLMQSFSFGGVTKSRIPTPKQCSPIDKSPLPQLSASSNRNGDKSRDQTHHHSFNILSHKGSVWWVGRRPIEDLASLQMYFVGYTHFLLVRELPEFSKCYIWDNLCINCPWRELYYGPISSEFLCVFSSPIDLRGFVVLELDSACVAASFCKLRGGGEFTRIRQDINSLVDPYSSNKQIMQFTGAILFEGKFYALSLQGTLALIEDVDSQFRITTLSRKRVVPTVLWRHFREYLVESGGEILLVFLISKKSINVVDDVEVFRLQFPRFSWVKTKDLGQRAMFVWDDRVISVSASEAGCRRNCVCFTQQTVDGWCFFDMVSGSILPELG